LSDIGMMVPRREAVLARIDSELSQATIYQCFFPQPRCQKAKQLALFGFFVVASPVMPMAAGRADG
jgi:hypothetical protein